MTSRKVKKEIKEKRSGVKARQPDGRWVSVSLVMSMKGFQRSHKNYDNGPTTARATNGNVV